MQDQRILPAQFSAWIDSFDLSLRAKGRSPKTRRTYTDAAIKLAWWLIDNKAAKDWTEVTKKVLERYMAWFQGGATRCGCSRSQVGHPAEQCDKPRRYEPGYANNQYRSIQQFWRWYAAEEDVANPMATMSPPTIPDKVIPVLGDDELARLISQCDKGKDFESRRDAALLRMYACTGGRLAEIGNLNVADLNLENFEALVTGKGSKQRIVKYDAKCAQALDRYLRMRATHKLAQHTPKLWLGVNGRGPLTPNGIRQIIERRGIKVGVNVHPHQLRHTFSHRWLDAGGAEGDLMELNGWDSPQMLARYGRSARSARARRHYDSVNVLGGI
jgi:integrase/recombinase XerD